ncbi:2-oxoisovalerate dehydrogenase E2 component (dihydrolipoyl transacylase) [Onishia taeanensis]|uniref:Dihydrolipoamide acetyltransferase component of pyruvate dehydrogenase complex n=1 Tax=Onishia taeanensis TaxID=284577 RepID=A0A328XHV4_9GAMM|nr:dihydrolipoyllysine-residue acetyltransferase [Halomonas taeanensis]RAR59059.1 2-oxoisovalerate dehydrogenase E2 component (dihydrolipoyl transacylase) [Halomonas taeanensis]
MSDFMLPDIGEGIVECEVVKWLVGEGDVIEEDQPVAEVMTDKALVEIPAPYHGRVTRLYYREGEIAKVHAPLFALVGDEAGEEGPSPEKEQGQAHQGASQPATREAATRAPEPASQIAAESLSRQAISASGTDFVLPDIGEGIVECEVVEWRIQEGDEIAEDQPVVDVMTDKALVEITAPEAGRVTRLYYQQGEHARVHSPLFAYLPEGLGLSEGQASSSAAEPAATNPQTTRQAGGAAEGAVVSPSAPQQGRASAQGSGAFGRIPASPAVRRLVREHALSLSAIPGSGKHGRVLKDDVLRFLEQGEHSDEHRQPSSSETPAPTTVGGTSAVGEIRVEPLKGIQAVMARRMVASASTIPHFAYGDEIDVTELLALRERLKPEAEALGVRLTLMPFFMKALALAVQEFPILNSRLTDEVTEIHYQSACNIGMAVDSRVGLMVPNVKGVERRSLLAIAGEIARLTLEAREGRVQQADLKGGTISISNIGALGGTYATPIINAPEVAIVAIGKTQRLPRFDADGQVVSRAIMTATWSGDHRVIDGGTIARFVNRWKGYLESPQSMLLHLG